MGLARQAEAVVGLDAAEGGEEASLGVKAVAAESRRRTNQRGGEQEDAVEVEVEVKVGVVAIEVVEVEASPTVVVVVVGVDLMPQRHDATWRYSSRTATRGPKLIPSVKRTESPLPRFS